jgi:hypothetical protein
VRSILVVCLLSAACAPSSSPATAPAADPASPDTTGAGTAPVPASGGNRYRSTPGTLPMPAASPAGPPGTITVTTATYGGSCEAAAGNVTNYVAASCNGKASCDYKVDYVAIGDPAMGCSKDFVTTWHCGDAAARTSSGRPARPGTARWSR